MAEVALSPYALAQRGAVLEVAGAPGAGVTSVLLSLLAPLSGEGPVAYVDARGMVSPLAAAEAGCHLDRLAFVHVHDPDAWTKVVAYLLDGVRAVAAETPRSVAPAALRVLAGRARDRARLLALAPLGWRLPAGLSTGKLSLLGPESGGDRGGVAEGDGRSAAEAAPPERMGRFRARLEGKLARGGVIDGVLSPPSLEIEPLVLARRLAIVP